MAYALVVASFNVNGIKKLFVRSVVGVPLMATLASVEDGGAFISTTQLLSVKANLFPSALLASLID